MKKATEAAIADEKCRLKAPEAPAEQRVHTMSPAMAKKLIRKTSAEHEGLFRRLAQ